MATFFIPFAFQSLLPSKNNLLVVWTPLRNEATCWPHSLLKLGQKQQLLSWTRRHANYAVRWRELGVQEWVPERAGQLLRGSSLVEGERQFLV